MKIRQIRMILRRTRYLRRPWFILLGIISIFLIIVYLQYIYWMSSKIIIIGPLPSETLQLSFASRRVLRDFIKPDKLTELSSPKTPYCSNLMIVVTSVVTHFNQRRAIRETWGQKLNVYFFLGTVADSKLSSEIKEALLEEQITQRDIVVEDFVDSYYNLTLKSAFMFKWVLRHCPDTHFIMKTDDDMFIHPDNLAKTIKNISPASKAIIGRVFKGRRAHHDPESKWYLPKTMYAEDVLPDYISGNVYVMTGVAMKQIYEMALNSFFFTLEDILFTGILAKELGIQLILSNTFSEEKPPAWYLLQWLLGTTHCGYRRLAAAHRISPDEMRTIWTSVTDPQCDEMCASWIQIKVDDFNEMFL